MKPFSIALVAVAVAIAAGCSATPARVTFPGSVDKPKAARLRVQVKERGALVVRDVAIEDYVTVAALSEVHIDPADESVAGQMYELQTVIARTYAATNRGRHAAEGFDLCSTTHCQLYEPSRLSTSRWSRVAARASARTAGEVLWFGNAAARAVFHADCGGHTSGAAAVWGGGALPYLTDRKDGGAAEHAHSEWTFESGIEAVRSALNSDPRTAVGPSLDRIDIAGRDAAGRAEQIILRGARAFVVRGEVFREVLTRRLGIRTLKSTMFSVTKSRGTFIFTGRGFGHGVGLCQAGALARLKAGDSPAEVLSFYFPGTSLRR